MDYRSATLSLRRQKNWTRKSVMALVWAPHRAEKAKFKWQRNILFTRHQPTSSSSFSATSTCIWCGLHSMILRRTITMQAKSHTCRPGGREDSMSLWSSCSRWSDGVRLLARSAATSCAMSLCSVQTAARSVMPWRGKLLVLKTAKQKQCCATFVTSWLSIKPPACVDASVLPHWAITYIITGFFKATTHSKMCQSSPQNILWQLINSLYHERTEERFSNVHPIKMQVWKHSSLTRNKKQTAGKFTADGGPDLARW